MYGHDCVCHRGVAPGSPYVTYFWRFLYPDAITIRLHGTQKQHLAPHSKHLKRTNTPLNQKGVSHRGVGVGVGVADSLRQRVLRVVQHGLVSRLLRTARLQVMPRQFDVQALINGLGIDVFLRKEHGLVHLVVGRFLHLIRRLVSCPIYLGQLLSRTRGWFGPTSTPQRPQGCGETHV